MNHVDKYYWITDHPSFVNTNVNIELTPQMVNPETKRVELDNCKNIKSEWWVEFLVWLPEDDMYEHVSDCDTGGDTAEEAISNLYELVKKHYGDYG